MVVGRRRKKSKALSEDAPLKGVSWKEFWSSPEKVAGTKAREFKDEEQSLLPNKDDLLTTYDEQGMVAAWRMLRAPGWRLSTEAAFRWLYAILRQVNNLLLPPLFTMLFLELYHGKLPLHLDLEVGGLNGIFMVAFLTEYLLGFVLARSKWHYVFNAWLLVDLVSVIPDMVGQMFRSLRGIRVLRMLKLGKLVRGGRRVPLKLGRFFRALGVAGSGVLAGAIALRGVEPQTVQGMNDSLWWSLVTVSTVGYGDISPMTPIGRVVAAVLILLGLGMFSYFTGLMTAVVEDPEEEKLLSDVEQVQKDVNELKGQLTRIERLLEQRIEPGKDP
jgi:voltage-gated potassium channel